MERALLDTRAAFDRVAAEYDRSNQENPILRAMRVRAIDAVRRYAPPGAAILDLGCGPGTDETALAELGHTVTAIDWSPAMVEQSRARVTRAGLSDRVTVHHMGIQEIERLGPACFDVAFSNFGPFNCVPHLPHAARLVANRLRPGGVLVASVIGRVCPWELALFAVRRDWPRLRVRFSRGFAAVPLDGHTVWTRYYSPGQFTQAFRDAGLERVSLRSLGLFAPPPYMDAFARRRPSLVSMLQRCDDALGRLPGLRAMGDHFLAVMRKS